MVPIFSWQQEQSHYPYRIDMLNQIRIALESKRHFSMNHRDFATQSAWPLAKRIEANLFLNATSLSEYIDSMTLTFRMQKYINSVLNRKQMQAHPPQIPVVVKNEPIA